MVTFTGIKSSLTNSDRNYNAKVIILNNPSNEDEFSISFSGIPNKGIGVFILTNIETNTKHIVGIGNWINDTDFKLTHYFDYFKNVSNVNVNDIITISNLNDF